MIFRRDREGCCVACDFGPVMSLDSGWRPRKPSIRLGRSSVKRDRDRALHASSVTGRGMTRVPRGLRPLRSLPAWIRTAALVAAMSTVLPWDALAHAKRQHD